LRCSLAAVVAFGLAWIAGNPNLGFGYHVARGDEPGLLTVAVTQVRESAGALSGTLHEEITGARLQVQGMVEEVQHAYRIGALARWCAVGTVLALMVFGCGFWIGKL